MTQRFSLYLDVVRFAAAMVVLLSHFAYPRFSDGDWIFLRELNLGSDAVVLFFVLSGFVIAWVAETKERASAVYFFNRATRLYSVMLPALFLTVACDSIGRSVAPHFYDGQFWYGTEPLWRQFATALTFTHEGWGEGVRFGTNGPLWSLAYEAWYYALFGAAIFLKGTARALVIAGIALAAGPRVMLLFPAWGMGVLLWRAVRDGAPAISQFKAMIMVVLPVALYAACLSVDVPGLLKVLTVMQIGIENYLWLRFSEEFVWNNLIGLMVAVHFFGVWILCRETAPAASERMVHAIRWLAGATFSIYVMHYPVMQMLDAILPETLAFRQAALLGPTLAACFIFAHLFERRLGAFRRRAAHVTPSLRPAAIQ